MSLYRVKAKRPRWESKNGVSGEGGGGKYHFQRGGGGINIVFRPKYRPLSKYAEILWLIALDTVHTNTKKKTAGHCDLQGQCYSNLYAYCNLKYIFPFLFPPFSLNLSNFPNAFMAGTKKLPMLWIRIHFCRFESGQNLNTDPDTSPDPWLAWLRQAKCQCKRFFQYFYLNKNDSVWQWESACAIIKLRIT